MVRRYTPEEKSRVYRVSYWLGVAVIIALWIWAFKSYFDRYEYLHPEITWAVPGIDTQLVRVKGVLLWKENVLKAPASGTVSYPLGAGPVRVARGAVVAIVGGREVKAYQQGYFVAGRDGREEKWRYSMIWPSDERVLNKNVKLKYFADRSSVGRGQIIGKLVEQPQELRFIGYMPLRGNMEEQIKHNSLNVRTDKSDTPSAAQIRVTMKVGALTKLYLTMPWFPPEFIISRNYELVIDAGQTEGALVPRSAVIEKDGKTGIYMIHGARVIFSSVEGKKLANDKFLITKGLSVGDALVENAATAREGRIQLW